MCLSSIVTVSSLLETPSRAVGNRWVHVKTFAGHCMLTRHAFNEASVTIGGATPIWHVASLPSVSAPRTLKILGGLSGKTLLIAVQLQ